MPSACTPCKLFVGGLSSQTTTDALREHFSQYGRLVDAVVMSKQGRPRGFGFVAFDKAASADAALAVPQWLGGRYVDVKRAVPGEQPENRSPSKIFVGGLPQEATAEDLRACFTAYGPIADAVVMVDRRTKRSRGFGFIRFASSLAAENVLRDAAGHQLGGKWVEVKRSTPAALLQDLSPSSDQAASSPKTPMKSTPIRSHQEHEQQQQQQQEQPKQQRRQRQQQPHPLQEEQQLKQLQEMRRESQQRQWERQQQDAQQAAILRGLAQWGHYSPLGLSGWAGGAADVSPLYSPLHCGDLFSFDSPLGLGTSPLANPAHLQDACGTEVLSGRRLFASALSDGEGQLKENRPATVNRALTPPPCSKTKLSSSFDMLASPMKIECKTDLFDGLGKVDGSKGALAQRSWQAVL